MTRNSFFASIVSLLFLFSCSGGGKMGYAPPDSEYAILSFEDTCYEYLVTVDSDNMNDTVPVSITIWCHDSAAAEFSAFRMKISKCDSMGNNREPLACRTATLILPGVSAFTTSDKAGIFDRNNIPANHSINSVHDSVWWEIFDLNYVFSNPKKESLDFLYLECYSVVNVHDVGDTTSSEFLVQWQWVKDYQSSPRLPKLFCQLIDQQSQNRAFLTD